MAVLRSAGYMEGTGDPNLDATINAGGGNIPKVYVNISTSPVEVYAWNSANGSGQKWQLLHYDKWRPWVKTGSTFARNIDSVLWSDSVFHTGKENVGANEATMPFESQYSRKTYGNQKTIGKSVKGDYGISETTSINIAINPTTGNDTLDITSYPSAAFQTLDKALEWINKCDARQFTVNFSGTSSGTRATLSSARDIVGKRIVFNTGFLNFNQSLNLYESTLELINNNTLFSVSQSIIVNRGALFLNQGSATQGSFDGVINCKNNSRISIRGAFTWNFAANNQYIMFDSGTSVYDLEIFNSVTFNVASFTGCTIGKVSPAITPWPYRIFISGGSTKPIFNGTLQMKTTVWRANEGFSIQGWSDNDYDKGYVAHGAKAIYTPNEQTFADNAAALTGGCLVGEHYRDSNGVQKVVMTSGTSNDMKSWTTVGRPSSPYTGMDGFNTTDLVREYYNGTNWIQY